MNSLALVYTVASRRAGFWMIPAFHSVLDEGIRNKHDDPQNFELAQFAQSLDALVGELQHPDRGSGRQPGRAEARLILRPPAGRSRPL